MVMARHALCWWKGIGSRLGDVCVQNQSIHIYLCLHMRACVNNCAAHASYKYTHVYLNVYVCIYIYTYIYIHKKICICVMRITLKMTHLVLDGLFHPT